MRYNPALGGLSAVTIILVLACHTELSKGGWIGADVFFVLSGYLITSILLSELRQTGDISLPNFYWRRALRRLPALGVLVAFQLAKVHAQPASEARLASWTCRAILAATVTCALAWGWVTGWFGGAPI
jgi:peptidoglycan/LPS O-acetylase OafA/YrhL